MGSAQIPGLDLLGDKERIRLDFEYKNGLIIVPVYYHNLIKLNFIFDTGAEHIILFNNNIHELLNLEYERKINLLGADLSQEINAYISRNIKLRLTEGVAVSRDIVVLEKDIMQRDEVFGLQLDGVLGAGMFNNLVVHINYKKRYIELHNPGSFDANKALKDYHPFDLEINNQKPYLDAIIEPNPTMVDTQKILIDTGAGLGFLLHHDKNSTYQLPHHLMPGSLGIGLSGIVEGYIGKAHKLKIGPYHFNNILTQFQQFDTTYIDENQLVREGIIGNHLLSRFDFYLDYVNRKLYLKAHKDYNKAFKYDKSGLVIYAFGKDLKEFYVKKVFPNTPASEAGIQEGDIIKKIGWWGSRFFTLEKISKKLSGKPGKTIKMKVLRKGKKHKVSFVLRDLLKVPDPINTKKQGGQTKP